MLQCSFHLMLLLRQLCLIVLHPVELFNVLKQINDILIKNVLLKTKIGRTYIQMVVSRVELLF